VKFSVSLYCLCSVIVNRSCKVQLVFAVVIIIQSFHSQVQHSALTKLLHLTLFLARAFTSCHLFPSPRASSSTVRFQVFFGLPLFLLPWGFQSKASFSVIPDSLRSIYCSNETRNETEIWAVPVVVCSIVIHCVVMKMYVNTDVVLYASVNPYRFLPSEILPISWRDHMCAKWNTQVCMLQKMQACKQV
jgi:hypothetical protein